MPRNVLAIRTNQQTGEQLDKISAYMGKSLNTTLTRGQALEIMTSRMLGEYERDYYNSQFFGPRTENGWTMTEEGLKAFVKAIDRFEAHGETPGTYMKAVQVTLHTLGFDPDWVERTLWVALHDYYYKDNPSL